MGYEWDIPSGKLSHNYGKIHPFFMGKLTISMAIFNSFLYVYQRVTGRGPATTWPCHTFPCREWPRLHDSALHGSMAQNMKKLKPQKNDTKMKLIEHYKVGPPR